MRLPPATDDDGTGSSAFACLTMNSRTMPMRVPLSEPGLPGSRFETSGVDGTSERGTVVKMSRGS